MHKFLTSMGMALAVTFAAPAAAMVPSPTIAFSPAFEFTGAEVDPGGDEPLRTIGYSFTLAQPTLVNAFGYWNGSAAGTYQVGLWNIGGGEPIKVQSVTITGLLQGSNYTYASFAPLLLASGSYVIGGSYSGGPFPHTLTGYSTAPGYSYAGIRESASNSGFTFPTSAFQDSRDVFGVQSFALVNLSIAAVPEPATWAMMLIGFGVIGTSLRRRRKSLAAA